MGGRGIRSIRRRKKKDLVVEEQDGTRGLNGRASFLPGGSRKIFQEKLKQILKAEEESTANTGPTCGSTHSI